MSVGSSRKGVRWPTAVNPGVPGVLDALNELIPGIAEDVVVDPRPVPGLAAHELVHGHAEVLSGDVPEGDVEGADRAHDGGAAKVAEPVHVLPVVLDAQRVLADQVASELVDGRLRRLEEAPRARLADARQPCVGVDLREQVPVDRYRLDGGDLHGVAGSAAGDSLASSRPHYRRNTPCRPDRREGPGEGFPSAWLAVRPSPTPGPLTSFRAT